MILLPGANVLLPLPFLKGEGRGEGSLPTGMDLNPRISLIQ